MLEKCWGWRQGWPLAGSICSSNRILLSRVSDGRHARQRRSTFSSFSRDRTRARPDSLLVLHRAFTRSRSGPTSRSRPPSQAFTKLLAEATEAKKPSVSKLDRLKESGMGLMEVSFRLLSFCGREAVFYWGRAQGR